MRNTKLFAMMFALAFVLTGLTSAQSVSAIYSFDLTNASQRPLNVVPTQGRDGKLYVTTNGVAIFRNQDTATTYGSVFKVATTGLGGSQLYAFTGADGANPDGGLTLATDGNYYGVTQVGGTYGWGALYRIAANGSTSILHDFTGSSDGGYPEAPPIEASDGNLYGTTFYGPNSSGAVVYKYTRSGTFSTLYEFSYAQGSGIEAPLIQGADGHLYGTTWQGGANGCGTTFKLSLSGTLLNLYSFPCNGSGGRSPAGPLLQAADGNFYGTTQLGGIHGAGTVFKENQKGAVTILYSFGGTNISGIEPIGPLVQGTDGFLYGTTVIGGASGTGYGTVFQLSTTGSFLSLYSFPQTVGEQPGGLVQFTDGMFYGTTYIGGANGYGSIFKLDMGLGSFITFVRPTGKVGQTAQILGQKLTGTTSVAFNGVPATSFSVVSDTYMTAVVPSGATTGKVVVTTPGGTLTGNVNFRISQ